MLLSTPVGKAPMTKGALVTPLPIGFPMTHLYTPINYNRIVYQTNSLFSNNLNGSGAFSGVGKLSNIFIAFPDVDQLPRKRIRCGCILTAYVKLQVSNSSINVCKLREQTVCLRVVDRWGGVGCGWPVGKGQGGGVSIQASAAPPPSLYCNKVWVFPLFTNYESYALIMKRITGRLYKAHLGKYWESI